MTWGLLFKTAGATRQISWGNLELRSCVLPNTADVEMATRRGINKECDYVNAEASAIDNEELLSLEASDGEDKGT
jgi:hypothetical protein